MSSEVIFTQNAAKRISFIKESQGKPDAFFRVAVKGGGCSGFEYTMDLDEALEDDDHVFEANGERLVIDDISLNLMKGATVDFVQDLVGSKFAISNPVADSSCGCGSSFSVKDF